MRTLITSTEIADPLRSIRRYLWLGLALSVVLVFGLGGWALATDIAGAVIASGHLVVESNVKKIQHPTGGVIGDIRVKEGQQVNAGDILVRLDPTVTRANLAIIDNTLDQLAARQSRLVAESNDGAAMGTPARLQDRILNRDVTNLMMGEERLFELRTQARKGQKSQLEERISQLEQEIGGQVMQAASKNQEITLIRSELEGVRQLYRKGLAPVTRVNALDREAARIQGELGLLSAQTSSGRGKIGEIRLQIIQIDQQFLSDVAKELRELEDKTAEFIEKQVAASDQLKRIDIRSPQDGIVHDLTVFTVGGVVNAGETIMTIVPNSDVLAVDVRITPQDISNVHADQNVVLHLSAFNQRTTPELNAKIGRIGADTTVDQRTGQIFYTATIKIDPDELRRLGGKSLVPGMPVEAFIQTGRRSVMSYLTKPLTDQINRAFRDG